MANKTICALTYGDTHVFTLPYGECSTAAGTAAKTVAVQDGKFSLEKGARVLIKFTVTNTAAVANLTLNVSGTGAKPMKYHGGNISSAGNLAANRIYEFVYDGTNWELIGDFNTNTTSSTGTTNKTGTKLFLAGATTQASSPTTYSNSGVYIGTDNCLYSNGSKVLVEGAFGVSANFNGVVGQYEILLNEVDNFEIGPYKSTANTVVKTTASAYTIYDAIATDKITYQNGRYGYGLYNKTKAYKIDHQTKKASLLCDLSSYVGTTAGKTYDRIMAVDDQYVYFIKHDKCPTSGTQDDYLNHEDIYGTIYKFKHDGTLVTSRASSQTSADSWAVNYQDGFTGNDNYGTIFHTGRSPQYVQTKDYILWLSKGTGTGTSGSSNYFLFGISKTNLNILTGSNMFYRGSKSTPSLIPFYDKNMIAFNIDGQAKFSLYQITDSGPTTSSGYITEIMRSATNLGTSYYYYIAAMVPCYDHANTNKYYKLTLWHRYSTKTDGGVYYAVVKESDINFTTGYVNLTNVTSANIPFAPTYYDPITQKFENNGIEYTVYPTYTAPSGVPTLNAEFTKTDYPVVNGSYYLAHAGTSTVYKLSPGKSYEIAMLKKV